MAEKVNFAELQLSQKLGAGASGIVRKADWRDQEIAVKMIDLLNKNHKQTAEREIAQLSQIDHENIVKVYGMANEDDCAYLLMEYMEEGSLYDFLHGDSQREYTVEEAVGWAQQCVKALVHLHSMEPKPVLHRDIKPQNMLLTDTFERLKICDFGTATDLATHMTNGTGTPAYMASEVYRGEQYTDKCDVYSFGISLWEMMSRQQPFSHLENTDNSFAVLGAAARGERPPLDAVRSDCWEGIKQLIVRCWDSDPARRPSAKQIEDYLGRLGATVNYEDLIEVLDCGTVAKVTFRKDASGNRVMRIDFWRQLGRTIRLAVPIVERETVRVARVVGRETARAAQDVGRETARAAQDGEREVRRAERDAERETSRAAGDTGREVTRAGKDAERETSRAAEDTGREVTRAGKDVEREVRRMKKKFRF